MYESSTENLSLNVWNLQFPLHTNPELTQEKIEHELERQPGCSKSRSGDATD